MKKTFIFLISLTAVALLACNPIQNHISDVRINGGDTDSGKLVEGTNNNTDKADVDGDEIKKEFLFTSADEIENINDEDLLYIANHDYITYDFFPEGEYTEIDFFDVEMLAPTEDCSETPTECIFTFILNSDSVDKDDLNTVKDSQKIKTYAEVDIADAIYADNTMFGEDKTGKTVKDVKIIFCGETEGYVEYSSRYTESHSYYKDRVLVTNDTPRAYRWIYMRSLIHLITEDGKQLVMLGELSTDYVKEQLDIYYNMQNSLTLYREAAEEEDYYTYTRYYLYDTIEWESNKDEVVLFKEVLTVDKETHKVQYKSAETIKTVTIP